MGDLLRKAVLVLVLSIIGMILHSGIIGDYLFYKDKRDMDENDQKFHDQIVSICLFLAKITLIVFAISLLFPK